MTTFGTVIVGAQYTRIACVSAPRLDIRVHRGEESCLMVLNGPWTRTGAGSSSEVEGSTPAGHVHVLLVAALVDIEFLALDGIEARPQDWRRAGRAEVESKLLLEGGSLQLSTALRILQEALTNTRRHSWASRVDILLKPVNGAFVLTISDNGIGIGNAAGRRSLGLLGMRERAALVGRNGQAILISSVSFQTGRWHCWRPVEKSGHADLGQRVPRLRDPDFCWSEGPTHASAPSPDRASARVSARQRRPARATDRSTRVVTPRS
jgi:hypothetical protein